MAAKLTAELGIKLGSTTAAMNALSARVRGALAPLQRFQNAASGLGKAFSPITGFVSTATAGLFAAGAATAGIGVGLKKAFDVGGELNDMSASTGIAVDKLMVLQQAFVNNGMEAESVGKAVNKLQKALTGVNDQGEPTNKMFEKLGLGMEELAALSPDEQLLKIGKAINGLATPAERTAAAWSLFGRTGAQMLTLFADSNAIGDAQTQLGSQAQILATNALLFDRISDNLGTAGKKLQGFFVGMADAIAPVIDPMIQLFAETDFAASGQAFGQGIAGTMTALLDGSIWGALGDSALVAVGTAVNALWKGMGAAVGGAGQLLVSAFRLAVDVISILLKPSFWASMGEQMLSWVHRFNQLFYQVFAGVGDLLKPLLDKVGLGGVADNMKGFFGDAAAKEGAAADATAAAASADFAPSQDTLNSRLKTEMEALGGSLSYWFDAIPNLINTDGVQSALDDKLDAIFTKTNDNYNKADRTSGGKKKRTEDLETAGAAKSRPEAVRMTAIGGLGVFMKNVLAKDPILEESRRQTGLLKEVRDGIAKLSTGGTGGVRVFA